MRDEQDFYIGMPLGPAASGLLTPDTSSTDPLVQALVAVSESERAAIVGALSRWGKARLHFDYPYHPNIRQLRNEVEHLKGKAGEHPEMSYGADAAALGALLGALEAL